MDMNPIFCYILLSQLAERIASEELNVNVVWWDSPPYIHRNSAGVISGAVKYMLDNLSLHGCKNVTDNIVPNLTYAQEFKTYSEFMNDINNDTSTRKSRNAVLTLYLPAYADSKINRYYLWENIGIATSPGMNLVSDGFLVSTIYRLFNVGLGNAKAYVVIMCVVLLNIGIAVWLCVS